MTFGEKIVFLRKSKGMSQDQLAELLGVTRQSVSKWERDEVVADTDRILALSKLFGVSCDYLLNDSITDAASSKAIPPAATPLPTKSAKKTYWHWFGLLLLLWGLGDFLAFRILSLRLLGLDTLLWMISQFPTRSSKEVLLCIFYLLALLFMLTKLVLGVILFVRGLVKNTKLAEQHSSQDPHN